MINTILVVSSSSSGTAAASRRLADAVVTAVQARYPAARVLVRDLAATPVPHLDAETVGAFFAAPEARSAAQRDALAVSDRLVAELQAADLIVLAVPMINFGVPAVFKAWIDQVARVGVTFRYTAQGPQGLLGGTPVVLALSRGGHYVGTSADTQLPWLRQVLGFIGLDAVHVLLAEGQASAERGPAALQDALDRAPALAASILDGAREVAA